MNKQAEENQSGVFVAAWICSLIKTGKITNSINSGYVNQFRDKMFMSLKIKDRNKKSGIGNCYEILMRVIKYRNDIYDETISGLTTSIPMDILARQTEHLKSNTKIMYDETNGRHLVLDKGMMKGDILGYTMGHFIEEKAKMIKMNIT